MFRAPERLLVARHRRQLCQPIVGTGRVLGSDRLRAALIPSSEARELSLNEVAARLSDLPSDIAPATRQREEGSPT